MKKKEKALFYDGSEYIIIEDTKENLCVFRDERAQGNCALYWIQEDIVSCLSEHAEARKEWETGNTFSVSELSPDES